MNLKQKTLKQADFDRDLQADSDPAINYFDMVNNCGVSSLQRYHYN